MQLDLCMLCVCMLCVCVFGLCVYYQFDSMSSDFRSIQWQRPNDLIFIKWPQNWCQHYAYTLYTLVCNSGVYVLQLELYVNVLRR